MLPWVTLYSYCDLCLSLRSNREDDDVGGGRNSGGRASEAVMIMPGGGPMPQGKGHAWPATGVWPWNTRFLTLTPCAEVGCRRQGSVSFLVRDPEVHEPQYQHHPNPRL